jgi:hypothetical protein
MIGPFTRLFRKPFFISSAAHLAAFGLFSFSLGAVIPAARNPPLNFWGALAQRQEPSPAEIKAPDSGFVRERPAFGVKKAASFTREDPDFYFKPPVTPALQAEKRPFLQPPVQGLVMPVRRQPEIVIHPLLPSSFNLYFKDRQTAHVEFQFKVWPTGANLVALKRKISCGNLEVDLLSQRYIGHYLFIQRAKFSPGSWQPVKIELSAGEP